MQIHLRTGRVRSCLTVFAAALALLSALQGQAQAGPLVIGGFDTSRGGTEGFNLGSASFFQNDIASAFPDTTFVTTSVLTPSFLSSINVLVITSVNGGNNIPITPLSADEQTALVNFVKGGGGAFIFTDDIAFDAANQSLINPFGLHSQSQEFVPGRLGVTVTNPLANPVTSGPFGVVTDYELASVGWYDSLGTNVQSLATLDLNGETALAVIDKGALGPGSGGVVFSSDTNPLFHIDFTTLFPAYKPLDFNVIAYLAPSAAVPEPASLTLFGFGLLGLAGYGWRRRRASVA